MWSDKYYYFNIYKNYNLSFNHDIKELREFINGIPELRQVNYYEFKNIESFSHTQLLLLKTKSIHSWSNLDIDTKHSNLIAIVCAKDGPSNFEEIKRIFIKIASFLNWKFIYEETDDGIENYTIWELKNKTKV